MTQQGLRQASVRAVTGTTLTYEGDWHALFDMASIPAGDFNGRLLQWINGYLGTTYTEINGAMAAFAADQGYYNWSSMGTFDPNSFTGILDQLGTAAVGAWSVSRVLRAAWLESALIRLRRSSDNAESDFGADANGDLDTAAITTWLGGANGLLRTVYDQSGNALDLTQTTAGSQPLYSGSLIGGKPGFSIADANDWVVSAAAELDNITAAGFCLHQVWRSGASLSPQTIWKGLGAAGWTCRGDGTSVYYFAQSGVGPAKYWRRPLSANTSYADTFDYTGGTADNAVTRRTNGSAVTNSIFGSLTLPVGDDSPYNFSVGSTGAGGAAHDQSEIIIFASTLGSDLQVLNDDATAFYGL